MALESLEGPVAAKATHVDAHVCAAGGEGGVVLPVHIQRWSCGRFTCGRSSVNEEVQSEPSRKNIHHELERLRVKRSPYLSETGTAASLLLCVHPK